MSQQQLRALFVDGLALGWAYEVSTAFRGALGIEFQKRTATWLQTPALRFAVGDYLSRKDRKQAVQVLRAQDSNGSNPGLVEWAELGSLNTSFKTIRSGSQEQFVALLKGVDHGDA